MSNHFSFENFLLSIAGHLIIIALTITSIIIFPKKKLIMAEQNIVIEEIDLNTIQITNKEDTNLYNINEKEVIEDKTEKDVLKSETDDKQKDKLEEINDNIEQTQKKESEQTTKRVLKVNRDSPILKSQLNITIIDALRYKLSQCWNIDTTKSGLDEIRVVVHLTMEENGTIKKMWFENENLSLTDELFKYVLDTIKQALNICQPFNILPKEEFDSWKNIQFTFYPTDGKVM